MSKPASLLKGFEKDVATALTQGNFRAAIRFRYLQLLRDLSERKIIDYRPGRSNGSYVSQLWGGELYNSFFRITRTFEFAWYGLLPVSAAAYDRMQEDIANLKSHFS